MKSLAASPPPKEPTTQQARFVGLVPVLRDMNALVIGCGSLGSHLIAMLSRMEPACILCVDHDNVSKENLGVQDFTKQDVGRAKAEVLAVKYGKGRTALLPYVMKFKTFAGPLLEHRISSITHVFLCVDTMATRKEIAHEMLATPATRFDGILVDGRLDANVGWIYATRDQFLRDWYRSTLYEDKEVIKTANRCAVQQTGYSAHVVAGIMVAQAMRFSQDPTLTGEKCGIDLNNMIFFGTGEQ